MAAQFTPGPWTVGNEGRHVAAAYSLNVSALTIPWTKPMTAAEERANADLIAAAPDMHDALKSLVAVLEHEAFESAVDGFVYFDDYGHGIAGDFMRAAREALAKAEGR